MNDNEKKFDDQSFFDKGILNEETELTPFHEGMKPSVEMIVVGDDAEARSKIEGHTSKIAQDLLSKLRSNRPKISKDMLTKSPGQFGTFKNGKFVSLQDEYNNSKGIITDREQTNSLKKRKPQKAPVKKVDMVAGGEN